MLMHMKKEQILRGFYGRIFTGSFTKKDGTTRPVWGVSKNDPNVPDHLAVVDDLSAKQYRRFDITLPYNMITGGNFIATG